MAMVETTPISGVVRFATIAGPAMAKTRALVILEFKGIVVRKFYCLSMILSENRYPLFRIMLYRPRGLPNTRIKSQSGLTITAPSRK